MAKQRKKISLLLLVVITIHFLVRHIKKMKEYISMDIFITIILKQDMLHVHLFQVDLGLNIQLVALDIRTMVASITRWLE